MNLISLSTVFILQKIDELQLYLSLELYDSEEELRSIKVELKSLIHNKLHMYGLRVTHHQTTGNSQLLVRLIIGPKRVLAVNTEEANEYCWDEDKRKRTKRT